MKLHYRIETIFPEDRVRPSDVNPNVMDAGQAELLGDVVAEFGPLQLPLYQDDGEGGYFIRDGHHRDAAFRTAGLEQWHAVVLDADASHLDVDRARLALNNLRGRTDHSVESAMLRSLRAEAPDLDLTLAGIRPVELEMLLREAPPELDLSAPIPGIGGPDEDDEGPAAAVFELKLAFMSAKELKDVRRVLRKAAGKGKDLSRGLLKIAGLDEK